MKVTAVIIGYTIRGIGVPIGIKELFEGGRLNELEGDGCTEYTAADPALVAGVIIAVGVLVDAFDVTIGDALVLRGDADKLSGADASVLRGDADKLVDADASVLRGDAEKLPGDVASVLRRDAEKLTDAVAIVVRGGEVKLVEAGTVAVPNADEVNEFCGDAVVNTAMVFVPAGMRKRS